MYSLTLETTHYLFNHQHAYSEYCWTRYRIVALFVIKTEDWRLSIPSVTVHLLTVGWVRISPTHICTHKRWRCPLGVDPGRALLSHILSPTLALLELDSVAGQGESWLSQKVGVLALPERWNTVITLDYATGSCPRYLDWWICVWAPPNSVHLKATGFFFSFTPRLICFGSVVQWEERTKQRCNHGYVELLILQ